MKKRIIKTVVAAMLVGGFAFYFAAPFAMASPECPNGCLANGDGCACNGWHPCYQEAGSSTLESN